MNDAKRRLLWHGFLLVLIGLLNGIALDSYTNPRMALSAHVGTLLNGTFVAVIAVIWDQITLSPRAATTLFWSTVYSGYANWAGLFLAAVFGTSRTTPLHGAGYAGAPWQEAVVAFFLVSGGVIILVASVLVLVGLHARR